MTQSLFPSLLTRSGKENSEKSGVPSHRICGRGGRVCSGPQTKSERSGVLKEPGKSGRELIPGNRWRPLKVIHLGLIAARLRKGRLDRTVSRAARRLREEISGPFVNVDEHVINDILRGKEPLRTDVSSLQDTDRGSRILVGPSGYPLAVWVGSRVTPMVSQSEITVMRGVRDLSYETKEEE